MARSAASRVVVALLAAVVSVPATYAVLRGYDVLFKSEANPATVIWSARIAMFWRLGIAAYCAGMVAPLVYVAAERDLARTVRALYVVSLGAAAMIGLQGVFLP